MKIKLIKGVNLVGKAGEVLNVSREQAIDLINSSKAVIHVDEKTAQSEVEEPEAPKAEAKPKGRKPKG